MLVTLLICFCLSQAVSAPETLPRFKAQVVCFNGAVNHAGSCTGACFQPDGTLHAEGKLTCGIPGQVSEITWSFVARHGDKDVYHFTRRFPAEASEAAVSSKDVEFNKDQIVVFKDDRQTILMEPPIR